MDAFIFYLPKALTVSRKRNQNEISLEEKKTHQGKD